MSVPVLGGPDSTAEGGFWDARLQTFLSRGSLVELEEIGTNLPSHALSGALSSTHREVALAALGAVRAAPDSWRYLPLLAQRAGGPDRPLAALAAEVGYRIVSDLDRAALVRWEIAEYELEAPLAAWRAVARSPGHYADVRVRALEVIAALARLPAREPAATPPRDWYQIAHFVADDEPEVRRAAMELWPDERAEDAREVAVATLTGDPDPDVALAAGQLLCARVRPDQPDQEDSAAVVAALGRAGRSRLIALLGEASARSPSALLAAARCLVADGSDAGMDAVRTLATTGPEAIRAPLSALLLSSANSAPEER